MAKQDLYVETKHLDRLTIELKGFEKEVGLAAYFALNRTIDQVITKASRLVTQSYAIKPSEVKDSFKGGEIRPTKTNLMASITSRGHTLSFAHFPYTPKKPRRTKAAKRSALVNAVMVKIKESKGSIISHRGFVATTGAKSEEKTQYNVFMRLGKERLPIAPIRTLSIPQMITNEKVGEQIQKFASEKLAERLEHEIIRAMTSIGNSVTKG